MSNPTYIVGRESAQINGTTANLFRVKFGADSENDRKVVDAEAQMDALGDLGGPVALINGPASLPVAVVLAHRLVHLYGAVGVFDPKMGGYVIAAAHGGTYKVGDVIPAAEVSQ